MSHNEMKSSRNSTDVRYKNPDNDPRGPYLLTDVTAPYDRPSLRYEWHGHFPPEGRSWRFTKERAQSLEEEGRIAFSRDGKPRLKRYLDESSPPIDDDDKANTSPRLEFIVRTAMKAIASMIAKYPKCLHNVEWRDLERVMREVFEQLGFNTELTRSGKDGGFDLRLEFSEQNETRSFLVEVKHWLKSGKKPGSKVLSALVDVVAKAGSDTQGLLLSSSGFTKDIFSGRTEVEQHRVRIAGQTKIVSLCQNYLKGIQGVWYPTTELSAMLLEGTA